jgi:type IV pilus assembly protein PilB
VLDHYRKRPPLGEMLVKSEVITEEQLQIALNRQRSGSTERLGEILIKLGFVTEEDLKQALCIQLNVPFIEPDAIKIDPAIGKAISEGYAVAHRLVPISRVGRTLTVAMDDPSDRLCVEELQASTGYIITVVVSTASAIHKLLRRVYGEAAQGADESPTFKLMTVSDDQPVDSEPRYATRRRDRSVDAILQTLISRAAQQRASDIHFEPLGSRVQMRFRVDGVLEVPDLGPLESQLNEHYRGLVSRIKVLSHLDISERRRPQDGSFRAQLEADGHVSFLDLRVSIIPGYFGESVVLRLLDKRKAPRSVRQVGLSRAIADGLTGLLRRTTGLILVTGPTGSGKSTTLSGCLMSLYRPGIRILTAEDPVEYVYENFSQCEVNDRIGNTFAHLVRSFLRHDPEVIMVGEIRDEETAEMALRAAQTGHLVLTTLHTNDALGVVPRLLDLKVDRTVLSSSLAGVVSQRLVRELCGKCKEPHRPPESLLQEFFVTPPADIPWSRGRGCPDCHFTGYRGRVPIAELWVPDNQDVLLINKGASIDELRQSATRTTTAMAADALERLRETRTDLEELIRTLPYSSLLQMRTLDPRPVIAAPRRGSVVVVEHENTTCTMVERVVRSAGYDVVAVDATDPAIDALSARHFDAVVVDTELPGFDPVRFLAGMKDGAFDGPVIFLTARSATPLDAEGLGFGVIELVAKPVEEGALLGALDAALTPLPIA